MGRSRLKEQVKFWRDPALSGLEMLHATYITYSFARHAHEGFGIAIVEAGAMEFDYRGASHIAPAGSVVVTHPDEMHTGHAVLETGWTYRTLLPASDWLQQAAADLSDRRPAKLPYFSSPVIHDRHLNQQLITLHRMLETSPSALERQSRFLWAMAQLIQGYASHTPQAATLGQESWAVSQARDYLWAHQQRSPLSCRHPRQGLCQDFNSGPGSRCPLGELLLPQATARLPMK